MTDIADLIDTPAARLAYRMSAFVEQLEERHTAEEKALDHLFEEQRRRLHRLHEKTKSAYKTLFDELLVKLNHQEDTVLHQWFSYATKTERMDLMVEVMERALPAIEEVEKRGGQLRVDIEKVGFGPSGCLYSDRKNGYFSFCSEFLDGYDDDVAFLVKRVTQSEREREKERERRLEESIAAWRAKERAKRVDVEAAEAAVDGEALREVSPATVFEEIGRN